jgi:predicted nucleic acid-binding Zn ribbon protein
MKRPAPLSNLMTSLFSGTPVRKRLEEGRIWLVWDDAVGAHIAAKARPVSFRDGMLTVAVANSPWMQQLTFLKQGIINKLNEQLGCDLVQDIFLKAGQTQPLPPQPEPIKRPERQLTVEETHRIAEQTASLSDPVLRDAFASILARDLGAKR